MKRLGLIRKNIENVVDDKKAISYIVNDTGSSQFRYRCKNISESIAGNKKYTVTYFSSSENVGIYDLINDIDICVIGRQTAKNNSLIKLIKKVKDGGGKVLFDIDDLVFNYSDARMILKTVREKNIFYWLGYIWGIRRIAKRVDGFLCTNDFLGKKLERSFRKPYKVIPNSLNKEQIEVSEKCLKNKKHEGFVIGYFSGSPTHARDFKMVEPELIDFLNSHDDAKLRVVGYMNFSDKMKKMINTGRVEVKKPVDYLKLQELMSEVDVNIAPLVINDFTNCKSELKFFEAAAVETITIASPTYAFKKSIEDGENGFLAQPGEWYKKIEYLYKNPDQNRKIAKKAREYALKHYYGKEFLKEVEEAYDYFAK